MRGAKSRISLRTSLTITLRLKLSNSKVCKTLLGYYVVTLSGEYKLNCLEILTTQHVLGLVLMTARRLAPSPDCLCDIHIYYSFSLFVL